MKGIPRISIVFWSKLTKLYQKNTRVNTRINEWEETGKRDKIPGNYQENTREIREGGGEGGGSRASQETECPACSGIIALNLCVLLVFAWYSVTLQMTGTNFMTYVTWRKKLNVEVSFQGRFQSSKLPLS